MFMTKGIEYVEYGIEIYVQKIKEQQLMLWGFNAILILLCDSKFLMFLITIPSL
jgi:hypothetical protein